MEHISNQILQKFNKDRLKHRYLCDAPFTSLKISMDGRVSPCCFNKSMDEQYFTKSLQDIWKGDVFESYRKNIKKNRLPAACINCEKSLQNGEFHSVKIRQYDNMRIPKFQKIKPRVIEMALSNNCNLECIMCNGRYSSAIRKNREKLPQLEAKFGQTFRNELLEFIPGLQKAVFAGGEPFLIPLYYDIWEDIIRINPTCVISVITNGTVLNDKVKEILDRGNFNIVLSFDAAKKETYENIRINASYEETIFNMEYFDNYLKLKGKRLHIPICPLKENRFEIPDIVRFCNQRQYSMNFVTVTSSFSHAMWALNSDELIQLKDYYLTQNFELKDENSKINIMEFDDLVSRIDIWIKEANLRENFKSKFDLSQSNVKELKRKFFVNIYKCLSDLYSGSEYREKKQLIQNNFSEALMELPDYFESNHFYAVLNKISPLAIINILLNFHVSMIAENAREIFYYNNY
ncbi:MAG: radical SAM protein [Bacteroidales bacterium]|nr:radical SAM protein [Bacteroidales bacterium]